MKSRKKLKKEIKEIFSALYRDLVFYKAFSIKADKDAARAILAKMPQLEDELIKRVSVNEGKDVKGRVKVYFNKLRADIKTQTKQLADEITALP